MWPVNDDDMMSEETVLNPIGPLGRLFLGCHTLYMWPVNDDDMMSEETVLNPIGRSTLVGCFLAVTPCTCGLSMTMT